MISVCCSTIRAEVANYDGAAFVTVVVAVDTDYELELSGKCSLNSAKSLTASSGGYY